MHTPESAEHLAEALHRAAAHERTISLSGNSSKQRMAGPPGSADECISTKRLGRVLEYEPHDLTISVEAGLPWKELERTLAANRQMVPLDPPFADSATVGGVVASNSSGPRRRLYGTARDMVIGMEFATLEGKLVRSGGMVVKNVAGLDMAKLMIGSFGTLAAMTVVNFKVTPAPERERSFLLSFRTPAEAVEARNRILAGVLQPSAVDLLNPAAAATLGNREWMLTIRAGGNAETIQRYERELAALTEGLAYDGERQTELWDHIGQFTPNFLGRYANGAVARVSCTLKEVGAAMESFEGPALARAGTGVCYGYFEQAGAAGEWLTRAAARWKAVLEFSPDDRNVDFDLWPSPGGDLELMRKVKQLFDPGGLLNRGRLYGRI
jgi:glycolate dehydrogenase FAD-binding subunit